MSLSRPAFFAVAASIALAGGCATEPKAVGWDNAVETSRERRVRSSTTAEYAAEAASFISAGECELEARARLATDKRDATRLMKGCVARNDFTSLLMLSTPPWNTLKFSEKEYELLLEVAMRRGGTQVAEDFRQLGIEVEAWEHFRQLPAAEQATGKLLEMRGLVLSQTIRPDGSVVARVRAYGTAAGSKVYDTFGGSRRGSIPAFSGSAGREAKEVKPIGSTLLVRAPAPLPTDRRVHLLARYDDRATQRLQEAATLPPEAVLNTKVDGGDPPEEAVVTLVASDKGSDLADNDMKGLVRPPR